MKNLKPILIVTGIGVISYALYRYYMKQVQYIQDIKYEVVGLKIVDFTLQKVSVDITNRIYNASQIDATITEMYLDLSINGIKVGNVTEVKDINIKPLASTLVTFRFSFDPRLVLGNIVDLITLTVKLQDVNIDATGYVKLKSSFIQTTVPFSYRNNLKNILKK